MFENFPLQSTQSRAAARALLEKRKGGLVPVLGIQMVTIGSDDLLPPMYVECDPKSVGSDWASWMTRRKLNGHQRAYQEYTAAHSELKQIKEISQAALPPAANVECSPRAQLPVLECSPMASPESTPNEDEAAREARFADYMRSRPQRRWTRRGHRGGNDSSGSLLN